MEVDAVMKVQLYDVEPAGVINIISSTSSPILEKQLDTLVVAAKEKFVFAPSSLLAVKHTMVQVVSKGSTRKALKLKRNDESSHSKTMVGNWVANFSNNLDKELGPEVSKCYVTGNEENIAHVVYNCLAAKQNWSRLIRPDKLQEFYSQPVKTWFLQNLRESASLPSFVNEWHILFALVCSGLWKRRYSFIFNDGKLDSGDLVNYCFLLKATLDEARPPQTPMDRGAAVGNLSYKKVELKLDNTTVVNILNCSSLFLNDNALVGRIRKLITRCWEVCIKHVGREANKIADFMAHKARGLPIGEVFYVEPSLDLFLLLNRDNGLPS
ncbi:hypothetical protein V6N12_062087 [Hibiscus sabdariffa]|uniref:RNase H type-1 domain-containing protein n=1 Tax=Hibiscus sabdariffa TaxID=183260 RepID=A0ABR2F828_9ROSI